MYGFEDALRNPIAGYLENVFDLIVTSCAWKTRVFHVVFFYKFRRTFLCVCV
jgi:hypothetical protein